MATVSKSSIKISGGGVFNVTAAATTTQFTTTSTQYAIVTLTNLYVRATGSNQTALVSVGGTVVMRAFESVSTPTVDAIVVRSNTEIGGNINQSVVAPVTIYVPPGQAFVTLLDTVANSGQITGTYTIFDNS